jgi:hypothetical protein
MAATMLRFTHIHIRIPISTDPHSISGMEDDGDAVGNNAASLVIMPRRS